MFARFSPITRRILIVAIVPQALVALAGLLFLAVHFLASGIGDPYLVKPLKSSLASDGASEGYSVAGEPRVLSVIGKQDIVVVSDPGVSFKYEVVWILEKPRKDGSTVLKEFQFELPRFAKVDKIKPPGTPIPLDIQEASDSGGWCLD